MLFEQIFKCFIDEMGTAIDFCYSRDAKSRKYDTLENFDNN